MRGRLDFRLLGIATVFALGTALGAPAAATAARCTPTTGTVSALGRRLETEGSLMDTLVTLEAA